MPWLLVCAGVGAAGRVPHAWHHARQRDGAVQGAWRDAAGV
jgi:hypothetical protein